MKKAVFEGLKKSGIILLALFLTHCGKPADQAPQNPKPTEARPQEIAGELFGVPVPAGNYYFAKRVHGMFQTPEEKQMTPEQMEKHIWHNLALSFEASRRQIELTPEEFDQWIDSVLQVLELPFTRTKEPEKYKTWVEDTLKQSVELFENQMRYMAQIEKLKREMIKEMQVTVTEEEMKEDFMSVGNHVGGEFLLFKTKDEADAFYQKHRESAAWEAYKAENADKIRPFHPMTVQAIVDLWGVPREQINAFHALPLGTVGEPMPFGTEWGVFRLLEKRTGDMANFEKERENVKKRVEIRKQYQARDAWVDNLDERAQIKVFLKPETASAA